MQIQQLAKSVETKKLLLKKRNQMIKQQLKKRQRQKVNLDQQSVKKGFIQKWKPIAKKQYQKLIQKSKKNKIVPQDNLTIKSFLVQSSVFLKFLQRTKKKVNVDYKKTQQSVQAILSYGKQHNQKYINIVLQFQKSIDCQAYPFSSKLTNPQYYSEIVLIVPKLKQNQEKYPFQKQINLNIRVVSPQQFIHKIKQQKKYEQLVLSQRIKCFVDFSIYMNNPSIRNLITKGMPIYPFQAKKVPYEVHHVGQYQNYLKYLSQKYISIAKSGSSHHFRIQIDKSNIVTQRIIQLIPQLAARLFQRSKNTNNKLNKVSIKTPTSISFQIYQS